MLILLLAIPVISIITIGLAKKAEEILWIAMCYALIGLVQTLLIVQIFLSACAPVSGDSIGNATVQSMFKLQSAIGTELSTPILGVDGISIWLIWLVSMLMPIVLLSTWRSGVSEGYPSAKKLIILITIIIFWSYAVFMVMDLLLFYISFEGVLIPMYLLIGYYGGRNRKIHAGYQFFMYTLLGSLFLLLALIVLYLETGTSDYQTLLTIPISPSRQYILWLAFFFALAIKVPMIPLHIWLPK